MKSVSTSVFSRFPGEVSRFVFVSILSASSIMIWLNESAFCMKNRPRTWGK
ncbi:hypothetical protein SGGMMB4_03301 [Sodalis glossinidius str. 'morsitans']|uniref:Uncharacterized protein n=1 Tax=Sodalis glossinidius (strain morsitans) TaxID=343509 RepID=A0A193QKR5_SODGM|nr:hypothetical protein SGGMMB4_03301 [Sodalis glossinidius str. 'morsitans']